MSGLSSRYVTESTNREPVGGEEEHRVKDFKPHYSMHTTPASPYFVYLALLLFYQLG